MEKKHSHAGHRSRLRQRFLCAGQDGLFEHELLELLLFYARPVVNTNDIAHSLTDKFGSMGKAMSADTESLAAVDGIGRKGAIFLRLMYDLGLNEMRTSHGHESLSSPELLSRCLTEQFSGASAKVCNILCLSSQSELLNTVTLPADDILSGILTPKEIASVLFRNNASSVCLGIYHGSRPPVPDDKDYSVTRIFGELLSAVGIGFTDCIICGNDGFFSMRRSGAFAF